jgi:F-type H+-transporting ATPase subunit delta
MAQKISDRQFAKALYEAAEGISKSDMQEAVRNFLSVLHKAGKLGRIENIIAEFENISKEKEGIKTLKIESARKLDKKTLENIRSAFGDKVESEESVREDLLGGVRIRTGDTVYDASLKKQLIRLKLALF